MKSNILIDMLPTDVMIDGQRYYIESNFRTAMLFELMINDERVSDEDKAIRTLHFFYTQGIPANVEKAVDRIIEFYTCGKSLEKIKKGNKRNNKSSKKSFGGAIYSFEHDANYIFSAFLSQYNIDLNEIECLHWWKFKALFDGLNDDNLIVQIMRYRATDLSQIKDKTERQRIAKLKDVYALPSNLTTEEKAFKIGRIFGGS